MKYPTLYTKNTNGSINVWFCETDANSYTTSYGQLGSDKIQTTLPIYCQGKNIGKSNETSPTEQCEAEVLAMYDKQRRLNYFDNIDDINKGFLEPQLAKPGADYIDDVKWEDGIIVDDKLNGWAFFATKDGIFTRKNKRYFCIPHIEEELKRIFKDNPNSYLQGEIFNPAHVHELEKLSELISVGRKEKDMTPELYEMSRKVSQAHFYDGYGYNGVNIDTPQRQRRETLKELIQGKFKYLFVVNYDICYSRAEMQKLFDAYVAKKGEGKILRNPNASYSHKRTKNLLKWKKEESDEFEVISLQEGLGNWQGCCKFAWCKNPRGIKKQEFKVNVDGSMERNREILKNKDKYVGKFITVRYESISSHGVPLKPFTDMIVRQEIEG